jgi:hypothetical protein
LVLATLAFAATLKSVSSFDLPGPAGKRFDYLTIDYDDHYLLSAHLAAGLLYVVDLRSNQVVKAIPDVPGAEGVEFVPELKKVIFGVPGSMFPILSRKTAPSSPKTIRPSQRKMNTSPDVCTVNAILTYSQSTRVWLSRQGSANLMLHCGPAERLSSSGEEAADDFSPLSTRVFTDGDFTGRGKRQKKAMEKRLSRRSATWKSVLPPGFVPTSSFGPWRTLLV